MAAPTRLRFIVATLVIYHISNRVINAASLPLVINTWPFTNATLKAWEVIQTQSYLDAVVAGCSECESQQCDGTVGYGGSPDEIGETTLDAMIMDGETHDVGSVGDLREVKNAIGVARAVMDYTQHTLIVGESARNFAIEMGFKRENLTTAKSGEIFFNWKKNNCQPNARKNVTPDPTKSCGPYTPASRLYKDKDFNTKNISEYNHDTIGMIVVDKDGKVVSGTSTNGASHKVPGRVGDSPIVGAGSYASGGVGGAAATGDGDVMMRFLPSFQTVMLMASGDTPTKAAEKSLMPIIKAYPTFTGAVVAANTKGEYGAACHGLGVFKYSVRSPDMPTVMVMEQPCI